MWINSFQGMSYEHLPCCLYQMLKSSYVGQALNKNTFSLLLSLSMHFHFFIVTVFKSRLYQILRQQRNRQADFAKSQESWGMFLSSVSVYY